MKRKTTTFSGVKAGLFFALLVSGMALSSCEDKAIGPQNPPKAFGDDPPKDTTPVKPPGG